MTLKLALKILLGQLVGLDLSQKCRYITERVIRPFLEVSMVIGKSRLEIFPLICLIYGLSWPKITIPITCMKVLQTDTRRVQLPLQMKRLNQGRLR